MKSKNAVLFSAVAALTLGAPLRAPQPEIATPVGSRMAELFDPRLIAQSMCGGGKGPRVSPIVQAAAAAQVIQPPAARSPRFRGLGTLSYKISTTSPEAQAYFDQGLRLFYAFNPGEAVASFRAAADADPACAMCAWGEALTLGPNLNAGMFDENNEAALAAVAEAKALAPGASARERALIDAVAARYSGDKAVTREQLNLAYADAMAKVYAAYKDDADIASIYAEAAMNVDSAPWSRWWDRTGQHATGYLSGAINAIEGVLARDPNHPGAIHLYIHAVDGSVHLPKAEPYADRLAGLMPNAGHMVHMPAHVYFNVGRYKDALATNVAAIAVDDAYLRGEAAATGVYRYGLYQHNVHFALAAADMAGDEASAMKLAGVMNAFQANNAGGRFEVAAASSIHPIVRFRTPQEMLALPKPEAKQPYERGVWHYARGTAYAYQGDLKRALAEAKVIERMTTGRKPQVTDMYADLLNVAASVLRGRVAAAQGNWMEAADHFATAVDFQDKVEYRDPPFWDFPVREIQGLAYYRAGKLPQAAEMLRQALLEAPNSGRALYALMEVSTALGDTVAAAEYQKLFQKAWAGTAPPDLSRL